MPSKSPQLLGKSPPHNTYKLNTDGSALNNLDKIGGGDILRDDQGNMIFAFTVSLGMGTNNQAELQVASYGLHWCIQHGYKNVILEVDSELLTKWIWWNEENFYINYTIEAIMLKEYATFRDLLDKVAKQIGVDLRFNSVKLKYKIEGSNAPLEIHNEIGVRVYVSLKKDNKELTKYPLCVFVFVKDCELTDRNLLEDGVGMCGIDGEDIVDTQALVLSVPFVSDDMNCDIITNIKHKVVLEDQVYKDKETLKVVMTQYAIDHRFQWKTN
ncbi:hypothetical protein RDI58_019981 [Solanum bulbocastanum]|uniref:RNase H type-1 domain-containing protein n=1 Tax=Solanum bulbocastanum TaxID=147425 RepID=A0AAN8Y735_SOLBU